MPPKSETALVRLSPEQAKAIDDWRRQQPDIPTRPEAIRRLIERGLEAEAARREADGK